MAGSEPQKLLIFGDSLSDAGNAYNLTGQVLKVPIPPDSAGYNGWFSNGLVQSLVSADVLEAEAEVYAVGGARAVGSRTVAQYLEENRYLTAETMLATPDPAALATDVNLGGQVQRYLLDATARPPQAGTVAAIWIGANDYNGLPPDVSEPLVAQTITQVVGNTMKAAGAIAATGVEKVLIYNLPAPDFFPVMLPPAFTQMVDSHNAALAAGAGMLTSTGVDVEIVDMHRISTEIAADPRTFGLNPAYLDQPLLLGIGSQPTWNPVEQNWLIPPNPAVAGVNPDQVMFTDLLHPSSATHGVLGIFAADTLTSKSVFLGDGNDLRITGSRDDLVLAGGGNDLIFAGRGDDTVLAGVGNDRVLGGRGDDILAGGAGDDWVHGGLGNDVVAGSDGDDLQTGGHGRDLMVDGLGFDRIWGNSGNDVFLYVEAELMGGSNAADGGRLSGGSGTDTLYLALSAETRAEVEAELSDGASRQDLNAIGVRTHSIERYAFVDPDDVAAEITIAARIGDADLWGIV